MDWSGYNHTSNANLNADLAKLANYAPELELENAPGYLPELAAPSAGAAALHARFAALSAPSARAAAPSAREAAISHMNAVAAKLKYEQALYSKYTEFKAKYNQHKLARMNPRTPKSSHSTLDQLITVYKSKIDKIISDLKRSNPAAYSGLGGGRRTRHRRSLSRKHTRRNR